MIFNATQQNNDQVAMERLINKWSWNLKKLKCYLAILPLKAFMNHETPSLQMSPSQPIGLPYILLFQVARLAHEHLKG